MTGSGTFDGTSAADLIAGSGAADTMDGKQGDDCILGAGGDDSLRGSGGFDVCVGGRAPTRSIRPATCRSSSEVGPNPTETCPGWDSNPHVPKDPVF